MVQKSGRNTSLNRVAKVSKTGSGGRSDRRLEVSRDLGRTISIPNHRRQVPAHKRIDGGSLGIIDEGHMSVQGYGGTGGSQSSMEQGSTITGVAFPVVPHVTQSSPCQTS